MHPAMQVRDAEGAKLIEQARVKVIPFLDSGETAPLESAVSKVETASTDSELTAAKAELKRLLAPYSYLIRGVGPQDVLREAVP